MANLKGSDNPFPSILIEEATEPAAPAAGHQRLYIDSTSHLLKATNSSGTDRTIEGLTDPMTTRGDILVRNASNVTARLAIGTSGKVLQSDGTDISWQTPAAASFSGAKVYNNGTQTISSGSETIITFGAEDYDTDTYHDTGSNTSRLTVPTTAKYRVHAVCPPAGNAAGNRSMGFRVNGSGYIRGGYRTYPGGGVLGGSTVQFIYDVSCDIALTAADYIEVFVYQNSGGNIAYGDTNSNPYAQCAFSIHRL